MRFEAKTDAQLAEEGLFPEGEVNFDILDAEDTVSKSSGADMLKITLKCYSDTGRSTLVTDYIVSTQVWKISALAKSVGLQAEYEAGEITAQVLVGQNGRVKLAVQAATAEWPAKNTVKSYVAVKSETAAAKPKSYGSKVATADLDDAIPF